MLVGVFRDIKGKRVEYQRSDGGRYYPRDLVLVPDETYKVRHEISGQMDIFGISDIIQPFTPNNKAIRNVILIRSGGFGDLLALSSITEYLRGYNVYFYTQKRFSEAISWHTNRNVVIKEHTEPLFTNYKKTDAITRFRTWAYCDINGAVETGADRRNWYEVFYERLNVPFMEEYGRPSLIVKAHKPIITGKSMLLCPRASAQMRTIYLADLIVATDGFGYDRYISEYDIIYAHEKQLCEQNNIKILPKCDAKDVFLYMCDFEMVVTTDSMPIHFREGIGKKALGIYASFRADSRTKHYKFTQSMDIDGGCDLQPCFQHEHINGKHIPFCDRGDQMHHAPCLSGISFSEQVRNKLKEML